jgi:ADP-ribosylglycohydrolase family protein
MGFVIGHLPLIIMLGSIIGDIVGSRYEFANIHTTDFELFTPYNDFTDDTICTIAIADALLHGKSFKDSLLYWCRRYPSPMGSYGGRFGQWIRSENPQPYNSFGNGSAMRVAPCGWLGSMEQVLSFARESAECTHNHPEGVKGAECVAYAIALALEGKSKEQIKEKVCWLYGYDLSMTCQELRQTYRFNETCQGTVPQAIICFLESHDFESALRLAVSIGGDSDTLAAITGGIAEAYYGIPKEIEQKALTYLPEEFKDLIREFREKIIRRIKG